MEWRCCALGVDVLLAVLAVALVGAAVAAERIITSRAQGKHQRGEVQGGTASATPRGCASMIKSRWSILTAFPRARAISTDATHHARDACAQHFVADRTPRARTRSPRPRCPRVLASCANHVRATVVSPPDPSVRTCATIPMRTPLVLDLCASEALADGRPPSACGALGGSSADLVPGPLGAGPSAPGGIAKLSAPRRLPRRQKSARGRRCSSRHVFVGVR